MSKTREFDNVGKIIRLLNGINIHPAYLLLPFSLAALAAAFEGVGMGLLIPLLNGFLERDFSFIKELPYLGDAINMLPPTILVSDKALFGVLLGIFVVAFLLKNIIKYCSMLCMSFFTYRAIHHLRKQIFTRYVSFGKLYFDRSSVGRLSIVLSEFTGLAFQPVYEVSKHFGALMSLLVYMIIMAMISWKLTLFILPLFVVLHFSIKIIVRKIRTMSHQIAERGGALGKKSVEILSTIALVKAYKTESYEKERYSNISDQKSKLDFKSEVFQHMINPTHEVILLFALLLLFAAMMFLHVHDQSGSAPAFLVYFYLMYNAANKFGVVASLRNSLAKATGPLDEVLEVFEDNEKHFVKGGNKEFTGINNQIEFRNLDFSYPESRKVLENLSIEFEKGKVTAIVGPTGSGKTTIVSLLMRYYDCAPDSLFIDDTDIREFKLESLLSNIALVSQETLLLHDTLRNNIAYGLDKVSDEDIKKVIQQARLSEFVSQSPQGIDMLIGDRGVKLSGGEKQRVSIARALLKGSEILVLDEATSSLDTLTERMIQEAIDEAVKDRTAIVIAHRLSTIKHADKIIVLEKGKVVEQGGLDELLEKKGVFFELWEQQRFD
ncbi:ABC transporter ATP-binding protein/permease [Patescibacteria group bacterium]|nr:ABC transporter ATP-binding protein/permease [Patescibacteria group bacterium]MBU1123650.1 ABC transporter ATP-binding protein/permease [Patescibacteria group bacterium]MBU1911493.1 ABC transporter ATP-binding protein/permease [Patescibacteria group bacterium]